jgi:hypothetical protein
MTQLDFRNIAPGSEFQYSSFEIDLLGHRLSLKAGFFIPAAS